MVSPRKLIKMAGEAKISLLSGGDDGGRSSRRTSVARKGHFAAYTRDGRRFLIPIAYLDSSVFKELLRKSEEEFGLPVGDSPITLPCDATYMEHVVASLRDASLKRWNKPCAALLFPTSAASCSIDKTRKKRALLRHG
ncbi:hypothetical protein C4D60_Mb04t22660 [Musa balbisiana]|uniref:Auxin-responsive protein n=1 Tax=Musa balbisiana TaxID=52838 RepID=A0A4S8KDY3_MUSBA|nr:hypothetical protein C4D60_Mb04t22660 [Musa balbisiana]